MMFYVLQTYNLLYMCIILSSIFCPTETCVWKNNRNCTVYYFNITITKSQILNSGKINSIYFKKFNLRHLFIKCNMILDIQGGQHVRNLSPSLSRSNTQILQFMNYVSLPVNNLLLYIPKYHFQ